MQQSPGLTVFIGGGNMASALIGGLLRGGQPAAQIVAVEPLEAQRTKLQRDFGIAAVAAPGPALAGAGLVVWAVKPQTFAEAAAACGTLFADALHLSVMAGVRCDAIVRCGGSARVVRAMPNTPALIGQGIAGLYARPEVTAEERTRIEALFAHTGTSLWLEREADLDAVTALSGSGPAYVFYFIETMMQAALEMGLSEAQGRQLAIETFAGAAALARNSALHPAELRAQVTSKGGTTHAAITTLDAADVKSSLLRAIHAARTRAEQLGKA